MCECRVSFFFLSHHDRFLPQPLGVFLVLTVHFHLVRTQWHAAIAVEVQAVVTTH